MEAKSDGKISTVGSNRLRRAIGITLLAMAVVYVLLSAMMLTFPSIKLGSRKITAYYNWFVLPGPFFRDDRIQKVPHFYTSFKKKGGEWTAWRNVERATFLRAHQGMLNFTELKRSRYERATARQVSRDLKKNPGKSVRRIPSFVEYNNYLRDQYIPIWADSMRMLYVVESTRGDVPVDTLFQVSYKAFVDAR